MKRFSFLVLAAVCTFAISLKAQGPAFTTVPTSFTIDDSVSITFNALAANACPSMTSDAAKTLAGFSGQVFFHGSASTNDNWGAYEPTQTWGNTDAALRFTQVGASRWTIKILPRTFFKIPASVGKTEIKKLFVIVRQGDCGSTGKPDCREGKVFNADRTGCTDPFVLAGTTSVRSDEFIGGATISPNPFNATAQFTYTINKTSNVSIRIFNSVGVEVKTVMVNELRAPGQYTIGWNGDDNTYSNVGNGVYHYRIDAEGTVQTGKIVLNR
ncbi:MAG: T9SS type A sorting domain-containing protein [Candidatus Kapabacteria bacterium]|nr:T9SS type A sorting domain-containing protein [Candidatus Kapabacteria bacterium]